MVELKETARRLNRVHRDVGQQSPAPPASGREARATQVFFTGGIGYGLTEKLEAMPLGYEAEPTLDRLRREKSFPFVRLNAKCRSLMKSWIG